MHPLADLDDPQVAIILLRHCANYCKLAYSARVMPPSAHQQALQDFDMDVMRTFEATTALFPDDDAWGRAQLGTAMGGLGLRSAHRHADAAYVASVVGSASLGHGCGHCVRHAHRWDGVVPFWLKPFWLKPFVFRFWSVRARLRAIAGAVARST